MSSFRSPVMPASPAIATITTALDALLSLLHKCRTSSDHHKKVLSPCITSGLSSDMFLAGKLLNLLSVSPAGDLSLASLLFDRIETPNIYLFNVMIRGFAMSHEPQKSIFVFVRMHRNGVVPNKHTFPILLKAFSSSKNENPVQIYAQVVKFGWNSDPYVRNSLMSAFANSGHIECARQIFDENKEKDVVAWTALIDGFVRNSRPFEGLICFLDMRTSGSKVDQMTIVSVLSAVGMRQYIWFGKLIHGSYLVKGRVICDEFVGTALIDMYSKCGYCDDAHKAFGEMSPRNVVSWTALIAGYVQCSRYENALLLFRNMILEKIKPNKFTLTSVLTACSQTGALDQGKWVHGYISWNKIEVSLVLGTALIDMYMKCGSVDEALLIFKKLPFKKDVYPWTAMINGLAMHGDSSRALNFFSQMLNNGIQPNRVTFTGVLAACSHGGLVKEGLQFFQSMKKNYFIEPSVDHYGCMVDLLARAGHLKEATKLIDEMPMEPTPNVWGALFGGCIVHKAFVLGEIIGNHLINVQPYHSGRHILLANLYSTSQKWEAAAYVRKWMKGKGVGKIPGFSLIEVDGVIREFVAFDKSHRDSKDVYQVLDGVMAHMMVAGYFPDTNYILTFDVNDG